jgi:hypothetical protein
MDRVGPTDETGQTCEVNGTLRSRVLDQNPISAEPTRASGHVPRQQAGHMTASSTRAELMQKSLAKRGPSTHDFEFLSGSL